MRGASEPRPAAAWLTPQGPREGLSHYAEVIRERSRLIVACVIVATLLAGLYAELAPRSWTAESRLLVTPVNGETNLIGLGLITNSSAPGGDVSTASSLVTTPEVAYSVATRVGHTSARELLKQVSAVPVAQSNIIAITATASSADRAQAIANAFALAAAQSQTQALHRQLDTIIPALRAQVEALPPTQRTGQGSLGERLASLETLRAEPNPTIAVASLAQRPTAPSWPRTKLSILAGALIGLVIGVGGAFALESLDPRIRREESLRRIVRLPVLARVPRERRQSLHGPPLRPIDVSFAAQESYRMLRVALGARGHPAGPRSMMITGSTHSEGKSTVALNLAATLASAGQKVILAEADLRRPSLATALNVVAGHGMVGVLMGELDLEDALIPADQLGLGDNLRLLLAEQSGPYLGDGLLAASDQLVSQAEALADYVVFDAPPVTEVSDALPLSQHVDDVLIVVRLGHSRTDQLVNLGEVLTRHGVYPAGLVIVGDEFSQGIYYAQSSGERRGFGKRLRRHVQVTEV
jgi:tyrosine-protein kinase